MSNGRIVTKGSDRKVAVWQDLGMAGKKRPGEAATFADIRRAALAEQPPGTRPVPVEAGTGVIRPRGPAGEELRRVRVLSERAEIRRWLQRRGLVGVLECGASVVDWVEGDRRVRVVAELLDSEREAARFMPTEFVVYRLAGGRRAVVAWRY